MNNRVLPLLVLLLAVAAAFAIPGLIPKAHAIVIGTVCTVPLDAAAFALGGPCRPGVDFTNPAAANSTGVTFSGPLPTASNQLIVGVFIDSTDIYLGFDITLKANPAVLTPADADLVGSTLAAATPNVKCIGGHLDSPSGVCPSTDTSDTIHFGASQGTTITTAGLLFRAIWNITGTSTAGVPISVHFQTGCGTPAAQTSIAPGVSSVCITMINGSLTPTAETFRASSFDNSAGASTPFVTVTTTSPNNFGNRFVGDTTVSATLTYTSNNLFSDTVSLSATARSFANDILSTIPTCSASLSATSVTPPAGGSITATVTITAVGIGLGVGSCGVTVYGSYSLGILEGFANSTFLAAPITFQVNFVDFTLAANPTLVKFPATGTGTSAITVGSLNSFAGNVQLSITATPITSPPIAAGFVPNPVVVPAGGTASSTATFSGGVAATTYTVTLRGSSVLGGFTKLKTVLMTVVVQDFRITNTGPALVTLTAGGTGNSTTFTVSSLPATANGLTGSVVITTSVNATGLSLLSCPTSVTLTAGATSAGQTCTLNSSTPGSFLVTITGNFTSGTVKIIHSVTFRVLVKPAAAVKDFTISAGAVTPPQIPAGGFGKSTITISPLNGFTGTVTFMVSASTPPGLSCITPTQVTGGSGASILSCSAAVANDYTVTVTGTNATGAPSHTTAGILFHVVDFSLSATPTSITTTANTAGTSQIAVVPANGFTGTPTLIITSTPPAGCTQSLSATNLLSVTCSTGPAPFNVVVQGTNATLVHTVTVPVTVQDFTLSAPAITTTANTAGTSQVTVNAINGFTGVVTFSITSIPPAGCTNTVSATGLLSVTCSTGPAPFTVTVQGVSGSITRTVGVLVTVQDFTLSAPAITTTANTAGTSQVAVNAINGFVGVVTFSITSTAPASCTNSVSATGLLSVTCSTGSAPFTVTVQGVSSSITRSVDVLVTVQDFTLSAPAITTTANTEGTSQVAVNAINGFTGTVTFSITSTPPAGCTNTVSGTGLLSVTCSTGPAPFTVTVQGTSGLITRTVGVLVTVQDFTLSAPAITTSPNVAGTSQVTVNAINGFTGAVTFSITSTPSAGCTNTISATGLLSVTCSAQTPAFTVIVQGTSGSMTRTVDVSVSVGAAAGFILTANPTSITTVATTAGTSVITVTPTGTFSGTVMLSISGPAIPTACTITILPGGVVLPPAQDSTLSVTCPSGGAFTVTVTGTSGSTSAHVDVPVTIQDFSLTATPSSITTTANAAGTSQIAVVPANGFAGAVTLSITSTPPAGCTQSLSATNLLSVTCTPGPAPFNVVVQGASGTSLTRTVSVLVTVQDFSISSVSRTSATVVLGGNNSSLIGLTSLNGFTGSVAMTAIVPSSVTGVMAMFVPNPVFLSEGSTVSTNLTIFASSTATTGTFTLTVNATSGSLFHTASISVTIVSVPVPSFVHGKLHWTHHLSLAKSGSVQTYDAIVANPLSFDDNVIVRIFGSDSLNPGFSFDFTCGVTCVNTVNGNPNSTPGITPVSIPAGAPAFSFSFVQSIPSSLVDHKVTFNAQLWFFSSATGRYELSPVTKSGSFTVVA